VTGENPYDLERIQELERQAGRTAEGILMWNPPWVLPMVAPLAFLDVRVAHLVWLMFHLGVLLFCAHLLWRIYDGREELRLISPLLVFTSMPSYFALLAGQISPLLLLGAVGFLWLIRRGWGFAAGAATVLLAIKPHLSYLFWLALLVWAVRHRHWRVLLGAALAGIVLTGIALALNPSVLGQYWQTFTSTPPAGYRSPTLGTLLRLAVEGDSFRLQFLPMLPGILWLIIYWHRHRETWEWRREMPALLFVSLLTTAYGAWPFDLVLLLLPLVALATELSRHPRTQSQSGPEKASSRWRLGLVTLAIVLHLGINGLALALAAWGAEYLAFAWFTPALLVGYLVLLRSGARLKEPTAIRCVESAAR
jgi:zinc transporter ZupT